ncbi:hypothetical protein SDC9_123126 [bioreactor metagenome]|uniref:HD domain-containing protein n=1 Tax=bioreactor metagenome TaxID=1076179 RepID=A0A645CGS7_9ZZZZ
MLSPLERDFTGYAKRFFTGCEEVDRNLRLKLAHTFRVRNEAAALALAERFSPEAEALTLRAALLHDLSRFEQFCRCRSFNDAESFDHGDRSAELAQERGMLDDLSPDEREDVLAAIRVHNKPAMPELLGPRARQLAGAVRDADKLDILPILIAHLKNPENESIVFGLKKEPELTPAVRDALLRGESPKHRDMRTVCDFIAGKLTWTDDLNYGWSRREFRKRGYLDAVMAFLPDTPLFRQLRENAARALDRN